MLTILPSIQPLDNLHNLSSNFKKQIHYYSHMKFCNLATYKSTIPTFPVALFLTISWCYIFLPPVPIPFSVKLMFKNLGTTFPGEPCLIKAQFTHLHIINTCNKQNKLIIIPYTGCYIQCSIFFCLAFLLMPFL